MYDHRPDSRDPLQLGFVPRRPVQWLHSQAVRHLGRRIAADADHVDTRDTQGGFPARVYASPGDDELWLDYVGGTGDGFDATYSIAWSLAQPYLDVVGIGSGSARLPRGKLLVMGGDQVHPAASWWDYQERLVGPYRAALPASDPDKPKAALFALPGDRDWADGLVAFRRVFVGERTDFGGWRCEQTRSYFGISLPNHWWLFGVDLPRAGVVDYTQMEYFADVATQLRPGDNVIVAVPRSVWLGTAPDAYDSLHLFIREVIELTGARVPLLLAADGHHYTRYATNPVAPTISQPSQAITCGGGGAYLSATHGLPKHVAPLRRSLDRRSRQPFESHLASRYPEAATSHRLAMHVFWRLPLASPYYALLLAGLHLALMFAIVGVPGSVNVSALALVATALAAVLLPGQFGSVPEMLQRATAIGVPVDAAKLGPRILIATHILAQIGLGQTTAHWWMALPAADLPGLWPIVLALVAYAPVLGLIGTLLAAAYLYISALLLPTYREALSAVLGIEDYKCFLRLHLARDGRLTVYPIALERSHHQWRVNPDEDRSSSWLWPTQPLTHRLIEPPIQIH